MSLHNRCWRCSRGEGGFGDDGWWGMFWGGRSEAERWGSERERMSRMVWSILLCVAG